MVTDVVGVADVVGVVVDVVTVEVYDDGGVVVGDGVTACVGLLLIMLSLFVVMTLLMLVVIYHRRA